MRAGFKHARKVYRVLAPGYRPENLREVSLGDPNAHVFSSLLTDYSDHHAPVLDLDKLNVKLIPSSTQGNYHLYFDNIVLSREDYQWLLDVLLYCGIIEEGYASQLMEMGMTCVRLPHIKKSPEDTLSFRSEA